jgi:Ca2+-transporting ATPase
MHNLTLDHVYESLNTTDQGLNSDEAAQRLKKYGKNILEKEDKKSLITILISQFNNPVVYLLVGAVIISFVFADIPEAVAIIIVILLNAAIGFWMEYKAQVSLETLKKIDPLHAKVRRGGKEKEVKAGELVPGDLIILEAGNVVPADSRLISSKECKADESPLTGESVPVDKSPGRLDEDTPLPERTNMLYKGTSVVTGKTEAIVTATGMHTEIGNISRIVTEARGEKIPLNRKLARLTNRLIWIILGLSLSFFIFGWIAGKELYLLLQTAIAWAVAAIPEGLPIVTSISLARGMLRLAKRNVIVQKLAAVETLGETTVILTDKTGTLTRNRLTLTKAEFAGGRIRFKDFDRSSESEAFDQFYKISVLCNDAKPDNGGYKGDPLDVALFEFASEFAPDKFSALRKHPLVNEDPFDSESMFMGTIYELDDELYIAAKGATETILNRCSYFLDNGNKRKLGKPEAENWIKKDRELSASGMKVIGFAYKNAGTDKKATMEQSDDFIDEMIFVGLGAFIDPVRSSVVKPLEKCHRAGIKVVMVTGDHPETALNIAKEVKLVRDDDENVIHGKEISGISDLSEASVFARVDPSQKLDIVTLYQEQGEIVGMTGDGVNDAPALKKADIGIAMGKRGTQVAREVADMVLKDDAFSSIVDAIEQGRTIFENIKKFIIYQLSYHLAEIIIIASISFTMFILPLYPLQLLFINLLSDVFPALALGIGKGNNTIMNRPPKDPDEPVISKTDWKLIIVYGFVISIFVITSYIISYTLLRLSPEECNNIAFFSLAFGQLLHTFDMRSSEEPIFINQVTKNRYVWMAIGFCASMLLAAYFVPLLSDVLSLVQLDIKAWLIIIATSILPLLANQVIKHFWKK